MQKALESLPEVRKAEVLFEEKQAVIQVETAKLNTEALVEAVEGAGFGASVVEGGS